MNKLNTIAVLVAAFVAVYLEAAWSLPRRALGCQVDLLPALVVFKMRPLSPTIQPVEGLTKCRACRLRLVLLV